MPPVPQQLLDEASATKELLQDLCCERTIAFGDTDSAQSLKTSLPRFNASSSTVWGARMPFAAVFVRREADQYRGRLAPSQLAMHHCADAGVDGQSDPSAAGRLPPPSPFPLFPARRVVDAGVELASASPSTAPAVLPPTCSFPTPPPNSCPPSASPTPRLTTPAGRPLLHFVSIRRPRRCSSPAPSSLTATPSPSPAASAGESPNADPGSGGSHFRRS